MVEPPPAPAAKPQPYPATRVVCSHCGNRGHEKKHCRRLLGQCLACGASDHRIQDCPKRSGSSVGQAQAPAKGKVFSLTAEEAEIADSVVEGSSQKFIWRILGLTVFKVQLLKETRVYSGSLLESEASGDSGGVDIDKHTNCGFDAEACAELLNVKSGTI